jgi:hypothetical protein
VQTLIVSRCGAAVIDITPSKSAFLYGYPHVPRMSTGTHDPLECAAVYLEAARGNALFLANDLIYHQGAAGNQSPRHVTRANTFTEAQRIGEILGRSIATALQGMTFAPPWQGCRTVCDGRPHPA